MALQLRRGTNAQRLGLTPVEGEMIYVTDNVAVNITVTNINVSDTLSTTTPHGLSVNQQIKYLGATQYGLTKDQVYFVKTAPTITDFTLSTTLGGSTLNITATATVSLSFAKTPTNAAGVPVGYDVSPLWAGDGFTVGGNPAGAIMLDELRDVIITAPPVEGEFLWYNGTSWVNENETTVDTKAKTLSLTRRSDSIGESYENEVAFRLQDRLIDTRSYLTDEGGPAIEYLRSSGTAEITKTYVSGGAIGAFTVTLNNVTGLVVGDRIVGTGLTNSNGGVLITIIAGNQLTLNTAFTAQASGNYTVGSAIPFGHIAMEWFGSTNDHRYRVATTTDAFLESPSNVYPGTDVLFEATRKYSKLNDGVVYVDAVNDRVGVNTTSPTTGLEINGGLLQYTGSSADRPVFRYDNSGTGSNNAIRLRKNYGAGTYTTADGVGLGFQIDSDSQDLKQLGIIDVLWDNTAPTIRLRTNTTSSLTTGYVDVGTFTSALATLPAGLNVGSGTLFVNATNNRVGINNTSPSYELHIDNGSDSITQFAMTNNERTFILTNNAADNILSHNYGGANRLQFDLTNQWFNSGNLGINNSSPTVALDVTGAAAISSNLNVGSGTLFVNAAGDKVGINNVTPNFELDVAGSAYISSNLIVVGDLTVTGTNITTGVTNSAISMDITSSASTTLPLSALTLKTTSTTTPGVGFGTAINFVGQTTDSNFENAGFIAVASTDITPTAEDFKMRFGLMAAGNTYSTVMDLDSLGNLQIDGDLTVSGANIGTGADDIILTIDRTTPSTSAGFKRAVILKSASTGSPSLGHGTALGFSSQTTTTTFKDAGYLAVTSTNAGAGTESFKMLFGLMDNGATYADKMELDSAGNLITDGKITAGTTLQCPSDDTVTSGAISLTTASTIFTTTSGNQTSTLAAGTDGQFKSLVRSGDTLGGQMVVTVTNAGWKTSSTGTITFGNIGDSCLLQYIGSKWFAVGSNDVVFA